MTIGKVLSGAFSTYAKKPLLFSGIFIAVALPVAIINVLVGTGIFFAIAGGDTSTLLGVGGLGFLLLIVVGFIAGVLTFGGTVRATDNVVSGKTAQFMECISYAFSKVVAYLVLALRVFWYSLAWLLLLVMLAFPVMATISRSMGIDMIGVVGTLGLLIPIVTVVLGVIVVIRSLKAMFSMYFLFDEENISTKDALKKSINLTKGSLWRIIGYWLVFVILIGIASYIIDSLTGGSQVSYEYFAEGGYDYEPEGLTVKTVVNFLFNAIISPIAIIYYFLFYKGLRKEKGMN